VTISLPTFARGQELLAVSSAVLTRLRTELEAAKVRIRLEVETALKAYRQRLEAVRILTDQALPGLAENERLTARSFEVGQLGLAELLLIRREILETRFQYLDSLLEAALARVELDASAGALR
jgi:cobalt-zinc-cadmium efflux system outer membrane protein